MMKKAYNIIAAFAALAVVFSCAKEIDTPAEEPVVPGNGEVAPVQAEEITISASLSDVLTKVGFEPAYSGNKPTSMALTWTTGDIIRVYDHADRSKYDDFTLKSECDGQKAGEFTGTPSNIGSAAAFDVEVYNASAPDYAAQSQPSDGVTTDLKYLASASNIGDYSDISFTEFSSILAITAKMPSTEVAAKIKSVDITASEDIFNGGNAMTITFDSIGDADADGILHFFATLPQGGTDIPAGTTLLVHFKAPGEAHDVYTRFIELPATTFTANKLNTININASASATHAGLTSCDGSNAAKAYLIGDKYQLQAISLSDTKKYYKLVDDIDMTGVTWSPWNKNSPYDHCVDFNGNNKSISHLNYPLFYVLKASTVKNLTFKDATINITGRGGTLAQFIQGTGTEVTNVDVDKVSVTAQQYTGGLIGRINSGSGDVAATISGCDLTNTTVSSGANTHAGGIIGSVEYAITMTGCSFSGNVTATGKTYVGGLVGYITAGTISKCCYKSGTVSGDGYLGGLVGVKVGTTALSIDNCYVRGDVLGTGQRAGGILGDYDAAGTCTIVNCYVTGSVKSDRCVGGIVGYVRDTGLSLIRCMPYNSEIRATSENSSADYYSSGVVVGYCDPSKTLVVNYCYRNNIADASWPFSEYAKYSANNTVTNHGFITTAGSIEKRIDAWAYSYYHHGRKTSAANLSALVQMGASIGESWSSDIWDFTGDLPTLK